MKKICTIAVAACLVLALLAGTTTLSVQAETQESGLHIQAKSAVLMDYDTGSVVFTQNEKEHLPIASMVKIMTLLLTLEEVDAERLHMQDTVTVSEYAASMGGSQAFLDAHSEYVVDELIKSIVVGSANDSCVALAEHIAGSIDAFVLRMNERAKELGMEDTRFVNCTGLPSAEQYCCAHDVALMTRALISHSRFFDYSKITVFDFAHPSGRVTQLANTNKLVRAYEGCDGGKTGFTNEAKYCLSATAKRGNTRLISVVCGADTSKIRNAQNAALFNYGFSHYETKQVVIGGTPLAEEYTVNGGKANVLKVAPAHDSFVFCQKGAQKEYSYKAEVITLRAPVRKGEVIGTLYVLCDGETAAQVPLCSDRTVQKATYLDTVDEFIANW